MRRPITMTSLKKLIMENLPSNNTKPTAKQDLVTSCAGDCTALELGFSVNIFDHALSSLVSEQSVVYFSDRDVRATQKGITQYIY